VQLIANPFNDHPDTCRCHECGVEWTDPEIVERPGSPDASTDLTLGSDDQASATDDFDKGESVPLFVDEEPAPRVPVSHEPEQLLLPADGERFLDVHAPMWRHVQRHPPMVRTPWGLCYSEIDLREWMKTWMPVVT
jgi:hypothetical protein